MYNPLLAFRQALLLRMTEDKLPLFLAKEDKNDGQEN
jgi:hypothetical protein